MSQEYQQPHSHEKQNIRELVEGKQSELNHVLLELAEEIEMWNLVLSEAAQQTDLEPGQLANLAGESVTSLDKKWPFMGDFIHVTGRWYIPQVTINDMSIEYPMHEAEAFNIVRSNGFSVFGKEDTTPTVGLSFEVADVQIINAAVQTKMTFLAYADPGDVSLYYVRPEEKGSETTDIGTFGESIHYYDDLLHLHYHNHNSDFYRKTARQQKKFFHDVIDNISNTLPSPEYGESAVCEQIEVPYVYRRIKTQAGMEWQQIKSSDDQPILMAGKIDGVGILESSQLDNDRPFRSKTELVDQNAGICLILRVEQCSIPDIFNNQPVYVPLRMANQIEIAVP